MLHMVCWPDSAALLLWQKFNAIIGQKSNQLWHIRAAKFKHCLRPSSKNQPVTFHASAAVIAKSVRTCTRRTVCRRHNVPPHLARRGLSSYCIFSRWCKCDLLCNRRIPSDCVEVMYAGADMQLMSQSVAVNANARFAASARHILRLPSAMGLQQALSTMPDPWDLIFQVGPQQI